MKKVIHHLRKQPEEVRRQVLHLATGIFAVILLSLWVYSLGATLQNTEETKSAELEPISALKANFVGGYKSITE